MSHSKKIAITGWPVTHSRSPLVHGYWLEKYGLDGKYESCAISPEKAEEFYGSFSKSGYAGCNVTVPHKEIAAAACDHLDTAAKIMGAANTLWLGEDGLLYGSNTDGLGFLGNLDQNAPGWDEKSESALVLGAGGASRAVVWSLKDRGFKNVHIFNRTFEKAKNLQKEFGTAIIPHTWEELGDFMGTADLLVNTTSLGMSGCAPLRLDLAKLPVSALVTDIVYSPLMTDLLSEAKNRGNRIVDGLGMLLHQAVPGFERWFGIRPDVDEELRQIIISDMEKTS